MRSTEKPAVRGRFILIDGENISPENVDVILQKATVFGRPIIKKVYGDFSRSHMEGWAKVVRQYAFHPVLQIPATKGKNASDALLIIDVMDMLHTSTVEAYVLVSSDSDFTRLVMRLRAAGRFVVGIGEKQTPPDLIAACDEFAHLELLRGEVLVESPPPALGVTPSSKLINGEEILPLLLSTIDSTAEEDERVNIDKLHGALKKLRPDFHALHYGQRTFIELLSYFGEIELISEPKSFGNKVWYARHRRGLSGR